MVLRHPNFGVVQGVPQMYWLLSCRTSTKSCKNVNLLYLPNWALIASSLYLPWNFVFLEEVCDTLVVFNYILMIERALQLSIKNSSQWRVLREALATGHFFVAIFTERMKIAVVAETVGLFNNTAGRALGFLRQQASNDQVLQKSIVKRRKGVGVQGTKVIRIDWLRARCRTPGSSKTQNI